MDGWMNEWEEEGERERGEGGRDTLF